MTNFSDLNNTCAALMAIAWFLTGAAALALALYRFFSRENPIRIAFPAIIGTIFTAATVYLVSSASEPSAYPLPLPWIVICAPVLPAVVYVASGIARTVSRNHRQLTPSAVKETLDSLDYGICFTDPNGRVILVNLAMTSLSFSIGADYPQTLGQFLSALDRVERKGDLYAVDNRVFKIISAPVSDPALRGFTLTTAQDVTEMYLTNEKIEEENAGIHEAIEKTQKMLVRLSDHIRERENLELKIRVHDEIGASLIALRQAIDEGGDGRQCLESLNRAIWPFEGEGGVRTLAGVVDRAAALGVKIIITGDPPVCGSALKIFLIALGECVTNCRKHADGKTVFVKITDSGNTYTIKITNDGKIPQGKIVEGGGLTSLRLSVEKADGQMTTESEPTFALVLELKKEDTRK